MNECKHTKFRGDGGPCLGCGKTWLEITNPEESKPRMRDYFAGLIPPNPAVSATSSSDQPGDRWMAPDYSKPAVDKEAERITARIAGYIHPENYAVVCQLIATALRTTKEAE